MIYKPRYTAPLSLIPRGLLKYAGCALVLGVLLGLVALTGLFCVFCLDVVSFRHTDYIGRTYTTVYFAGRAMLMLMVRR